MAAETTELEVSASTTTLGDIARKTASTRRKAAAYSLLGAVTVLVIWQIASTFQRTEFDLLPSPAEVAGRMWDYVVGDPARGIEPGTVFINFWETLRKTLIGFVGAVVVGVPIGILMGRYRYAKNFFFDMVYLAANVPLIVYAILGILLFGLGDAGPAFVVALLVLPVIALNVAAGRRGRGPAAAGDEPGVRPAHPGGDARHRRAVVLPVPVRGVSGLVRGIVEAGGARRDVRRHDGRRCADPEGVPGLLRPRHDGVDDVLRDLRGALRARRADACWSGGCSDTD